MTDLWDDDPPAITEEQAAKIAERLQEESARIANDPAAQEELRRKLALVEREQCEKRTTPRLSLEENKSQLRIATKADEQDGELIAEFKRWLGRFDSGYLSDHDVRHKLVEGFVSIIEGFDQDNHPAQAEQSQIRASDQALLNLRDQLMELPTIAQSTFPKDIANGIAGQIIRPAITAAGKLGITRPGITKDLFMREEEAVSRY